MPPLPPPPPPPPPVGILRAIGTITNHVSRRAEGVGPEKRTNDHNEDANHDAGNDEVKLDVLPPHLLLDLGGTLAELVRLALQLICFITKATSAGEAGHFPRVPVLLWS